jgi:dTDP-4-amino-4,6-dideoxygalactose transaminase
VKIPITKPFFGPEELAAVREPLETGWVVQGPKVAEFERLFADYCKASHAIAATSCTAALHLALASLGIGQGDEVIVPAFTFVASANAIEYQSARPVFVDIDLNTYNINVAQIRGRITERTRAIMPVSLFGLSADMEPILAIAKEHGVPVVEDAACAVGSWYRGCHAGTLAQIGCLSFHPRKAITTGEGGMVLTQDRDLAGKVRMLRDHGASVGDLERHSETLDFLLSQYNCVGYNYRMTDLQGAIGVAQMGKLHYILERRRDLARRYDDALGDLPWLELPIAPTGYVHGYQSYVCLFRPERPTLHNVARLHELRNSLMLELRERGVATRQGTHAVHTLGFYRKRYSLEPQDFPNAYLADRLTITLPMYTQMTDEEFNYVVRSLREVGNRIAN